MRANIYEERYAPKPHKVRYNEAKKLNTDDDKKYVAERIIAIDELKYLEED